MKYNRHFLRTAGIFSAALIAAGSASAGSKSTNPQPLKRHLTKSLDVCDFGAFFVGGVPKLTQYANSITPTGYQELIIGHMYVQFMIPNERRGWPIIMVHGGGYSGSGLESTPDEREGWFAYSVRNHNATFVVDQAGRGRSGFDRSFINERIATGNLANFPNLGNTSSSGIWTAWFGHLINGADITTGLLIKHGDPADPSCATDPKHCPPVTPAHPFDAVDPDIQARVGAIGPAPNPANNKQLALEHYKYGLPNTNVTLPDSTCPTCTPTTVNGADTWSGQDLAKLVNRLGGAVVVTHSQSGSVGHHMVRYLKAAGNLDQLKGLVTIDGSCSLTGAGIVAQDFAKIPYMALRGWYLSGSTAICDATVAAINSAGGTAESIKLDDPKFGNQFQGVTHMMMLGNNHLKVFDVIQDWVGKHVAGQSKKVACGRSNNDHDSDLGHDCGPHHDEICY